MLKIGITGGIASGKSLVSNWLKKLSFPLIDADQAARKVVRPGEDGLKCITEAFGNQILKADGSLDRRQLAKIIFHCKSRREQLNSLLHPLIRSKMLNELNGYEADNVPAAFLDIPLLFESGLDEWVDRTILVAVPEDVQLSRLMQRDGISRGHALEKIRSQMPLEEKRKRATAVIDNSGDSEQTLIQMRQLLCSWNLM